MQHHSPIIWPATRREAAAICWGASGFIVLVLLARAAAGAFVSPVEPGWVLAATAGMLGGNLLAWWWSDAESSPLRERIAAAVIALVPPLTLGLLLAGASAATVQGVLLVTTLGLACVLHRLVRSQPEAVEAAATLEAARETYDAAEEGCGPETGESSAPFDDPAVTQQMVRRVTADGRDTLEVLLRIEFAPAEREVTVHVPIQPSMDGIPELDCEPLDDSDVEVRAAAVHLYGVRIEAKRAGDVESAAVVPLGVLLASPRAAEAAA